MADTTAPDLDPAFTELPVFTPGRFRLLPASDVANHSRVACAFDHQLGRLVACKYSMDPTVLSTMVSDELDSIFGPGGYNRDMLATAADVGRRYNLLHEARLLALVDHPNVIPVLEIGRFRDRVVALLLPYLDGGTAATRDFSGSWASVLETAIQIGRGVAALHAAGILHRDLKPNNVIFDSAGWPRVADLGLSCEMTDTSAMQERVGTVAYMPPGAFEHGFRDVRDDLYAFCLIVFEMLYGRAPFDSPEDRERGRMAKVERKGGVPPDLHAILVRGLAPDLDYQVKVLRFPLGTGSTTLVRASDIEAEHRTNLMFDEETGSLALPSSANRVLLWNPYKGVQSNDLGPHDAAIGWIRVSANGLVVAAADVKGSARISIFDEAKRLRGDISLKFDDITDIQLSPDGATLLVAQSKGSWFTWDVKSHRKNQVVSTDFSIPQFLLDPLHRVVVGISEKSNIMVWDVDGKLLKDLSEEVGLTPRALAFSPDGRWLAVGDSSGSLSLWDVGSWQMLHRERGHLGAVVSVAYSLDGQTIATGDDENTVRVWKRVSVDTWVQAACTELRNVLGEVDLPVGCLPD